MSAIAAKCGTNSYVWEWPYSWRTPEVSPCWSKTFGLAFHDAIISESPVLEGPEATKLGGIFHRIVETSPVKTGPQLPHRIFIIASSVPNAFATAGGRVYVTAGL